MRAAKAAYRNFSFGMVSVTFSLLAISVLLALVIGPLSILLGVLLTAFILMLWARIRRKARAAGI